MVAQDTTEPGGADQADDIDVDDLDGVSGGTSGIGLGAGAVALPTTHGSGPSTTSSA